MPPDPFIVLCAQQTVTATLRALLLSVSAWIRSWSPARVCLNGCDDITYLPLVLAMHNRWYTGQCVCGCKCIVSALVNHVANSSSAILKTIVYSPPCMGSSDYAVVGLA